MENKRIFFTGPQKVEIVTEEAVKPAAGQIMVKLAVSSISSGTERANLLGTEAVTIQTNTIGPVYPVRPGYSSSGTVVELGEGVTEFQIGDRVALSWSSHSQYVTISTGNVHKLEDEVGFSEAALLHIATFPMAAIRKCRLEMGESAMVMGQGVLGQIAVQLLRAAGALPVIAVDPVPEKRALALQYGADYALDPRDPDFAKTVRKLTHGGVKVAIEVTGLGQGLDNALDCMAKFGRVALLGCTRRSDFTIDYYHKVHGPGISLIGAHTLARPERESSAGMWTTHDDAMALMRMQAAGRIDLRSLVEEIHAPYEAPEVYRRLATEKSFPVVQFDWTKMN